MLQAAAQASNLRNSFDLRPEFRSKSRKIYVGRAKTQIGPVPWKSRSAPAQMQSSAEGYTRAVNLVTFFSMPSGHQNQTVFCSTGVLRTAGWLDSLILFSPGPGSASGNCTINSVYLSGVERRLISPPSFSVASLAR